jgi:hypothetical protein
MSFQSKSLVTALTLLLSATSVVAESLTADQLAGLVAQRPVNEGRAAIMNFRLQNQSGSLRVRQARMISSKRGDVERIAIFFTAPAMIEETAFLSINYVSMEDETWLYLPAANRVRRLPGADRGDYFMGTDLTFGDVKENFKFGLDDWVFTLGAEEVVDGITFQVLEGAARTPEIGKDMGYGHFRARIDADGFPARTTFFDVDMAPIKVVELLTVEQVGDAKMATRLVTENLRTGHRTEINYTDVKDVPGVDESIFDPNALSYGIPDAL